MFDYAFTKKGGHEVKKQKYAAHRAYKYAAKRKIRGKQPIPLVKLGMRNVRRVLPRKISILVDTGASISTLKASSADELKIDRWPMREERLVAIRSAGDFPVIGLPRRVCIYLGGLQREISVIVPSRVEVDPGGRFVIGSAPKRNLLGREGILENYLLCFDSQRLYAFPKHKG